MIPRNDTENQVSEVTALRNNLSIYKQRCTTLEHCRSKDTKRIEELIKSVERIQRDNLYLTAELTEAREHLNPKAAA